MSGRILIIDQVATNRIVLKVRLCAAHYDVVTACTPADGIDVALKVHPDLIIVPSGLGDAAAPHVCARLRTFPDIKDIPVLVVSDDPSDAQTMECLDAGAQDVLPRTMAEPQFLAHVRRVLRASASAYELRLRETTNRALGFAEDDSPFAARPNALILLNDPDAPPEWCAGLIAAGGIQARIGDVDNAGRNLMSETDNAPVPDVFVLPLIDGRDPADLSVITALRSAPSTRHIAIVVVLSRSNPALVNLALDLGADDLVYDNSPLAEICLRIRRQAQRKQTAERLRARVKDGLIAAVTDPLTGLFNRRYALPHLEQMAKAAQTTGKPYALMMLDLDRFKQVNDTYGHPAGDAVLVEVARRLQENLRAIDLIARMGGEEFLIAMPSATLHQAKAAAHRLRRVICHAPVTVPDLQVSVPISISIGLSMGGCQGRLAETSHVLQLADNALNQAKCDGRNTVTVSRTAA